jgi:protein phosphatase 1 regulatory subunit 42
MSRLTKRYDFTGRAGRERKVYRMTPALFMHRSTSSARIAKDETEEDFVKRLTHLKLQDKNIKEIENLEEMKALQVLYLQDNRIVSMAPLQCCARLTNLHLSRNGIKVIEGLNVCVNLRKLFLEGNEISHVSGLENNAMLEELNLSNQKLANGDSLTFDETCLDILGGNLQTLTIDGNNIKTATQFLRLAEIQIFQCRKNKLEDVGELVELIASLSEVKKVDLSGNPACRAPKFRETLLINCSNRLQALNGKDIDMKQRDALIRFAQHRQQRSERKAAAKQQQQLHQQQQGMPKHHHQQRQPLSNQHANNFHGSAHQQFGNGDVQGYHQ